MKAYWRVANSCLLLSCFAASLAAQEMQPRAYVPAPVGLNFLGLSYSRNAGGMLFDPSLPVEDSHVVAKAPALAFGQSLGVLGRSAQVLVVAPCVQADLTGIVAGAQQHGCRSGVADMTFRYSMNLHGAPAMHLPEFAPNSADPS